MSAIIRMCFVSALLFLNILFSAAYAIQFPAPPSNHNFYVDKANLIQPDVRKEINQIAGKLWHERKIPFFVVTIPSLITQGAMHYTIKDYATALFNTWGIGSKEKSYGILLVVSKAERNASITLGTGWGQAFDTQKFQIMKQVIAPDFEQGDFSNGILKSVADLNAMTIGINIPAQSQLVNSMISTSNAGNSLWQFYLLKIILVCSIVIIIFSIFKNNQRSRVYTKPRKNEERNW